MWLDRFRRRRTAPAVDVPGAQAGQHPRANAPLESWSDEAIRTLVTSLEWDIDELGDRGERRPRRADDIVMPPPA
jgi:hypothetical protein